VQADPRRLAVLGSALGCLLALTIAASATSAPGDATATQVADIRNPGDSAPANLFDANGTLLFSADDGVHGTELWKSNGGPLGAGGTEMLPEISPGSGAAGSSNPSGFVQIGNTIFFAASDGSGLSDHGVELWKTDPPFTTVTMVDDINDGPDASDPEELTNVAGILFFRANDGASGEELWKLGPSSSTPVQVDEINSAPGIGGSPNGLVGVGGNLIFSADDGSGSGLWKVSPPDYDSVVGIDLGGSSSAGSDPQELTDVDGTLLFAAMGPDGVELWRSDAPFSDSSQVEDINGSGSSNPFWLTNVNGTLFFTAADGIVFNVDHGNELWKSVPPYDAASTNLVADIDPNSSSSNPGELADVGGTLYLAASDGTHGFELWKSDGGPLNAGTSLVADINLAGNSSPAEITDVGGQAFFRATQIGINNNELFKSNGTGATLIREINPDPNTGSSPVFLTNVNGTLFLRANDGSTGNELWKATIEPSPPAATPATPVPAPATTTKRKCKKKHGKKQAASAKKKKCKKKKK
jgi:ELWxxDGT repeat protein